MKRIALAVLLLASLAPRAHAQVSWGGQRLTDVGQPSSANDAATKTYVDTHSGGGGGGTSGITQLTGDGTAGPGSGSQVFTLAASGITAATYGSATAVMVCAIDAKGRATSCSSTTISIPSTAISDSTSLGRSLMTVGSAGAAQTLIALVPGTNVQAQDAELQAIAGLTSAADRLPYFTGSGTASLAPYTSLARTWDAFTTSAQQTAAINAFTSSLPGLATASGGGTANFMLADGTWVPALKLSGGAMTGTLNMNGQAITGTSLYYHGSEIDNGNKTGASQSIGTFTAGDRQKITLTGAVSSSTWTVPAGVVDWRLKVCQDATGIPHTIVWPTSPAITWETSGGTAPTLSTGAGLCDFIAFYNDGTTVWGIPNVPSSGGGGGALTIAGDATGSVTVPGTLTLTNVNAPTGFTHAGTVVNTEVAAPGTPAAGKVTTWTDSTDARFHDKNPAGTIATTVVPDTGAANNYINAISPAGVITKSQPSFSNLSGTGTCAQEPALAGVVTSSAGSCTTAFASTTGTGATVQATSPTLVTPTFSGGATVSSGGIAMGGTSITATQVYGYTRLGNGNKGGASPALLAWSAGSWQSLTQTSTFTGTPTWTLPSISQSLRLDVCMDATGGYSWLWPAGITWVGGVAPVPVNTANACTRFTFTYDGTTTSGTSSVLYALTASLGSSAFGAGKTLLRCSTLTTGTTLAKAAGTTLAQAWLWGGGAGGGGCVASATGTGCVAGGGSSGAKAFYQTTTIPAVTWTYAIGAPGAGGTTSGTTGSVGGSTTLNDGTTTCTAPGGNGGLGMATASATINMILGGAPPSVSTNCTINGAGPPGGFAMMAATATMAHSGDGGSTEYGGGGQGRVTNGAGNPGVGAGAGGGGAYVLGNAGAAAAGGAGIAGAIELCEYQ